MITGAILVNSILKLTVLHSTIYRNLFSFLPCLHLVASTAIEHAVFVSTVILGNNITNHNDSTYSPKGFYAKHSSSIWLDLFVFQLGTSCLTSAIDTCIYITSGLWCLPNSRHLMNGQTKFKRKVYLALAFPEIFKVAAVLLQIFDNEPTLLVLIGLLIISIQQISLESVTSISTHKLNMIIFASVGLRLLVRCFFHRFFDVWLLGVVC